MRLRPLTTAVATTVLLSCWLFADTAVAGRPFSRSDMPPPPKPSLSLAMTPSAPAVALDGSVTYTLMVKNAGPGAVRNGVVTMPVQAGLIPSTIDTGCVDVRGTSDPRYVTNIQCLFGAMSAGGQKKFALTFKVTKPIACGNFMASAIAGDAYDASVVATASATITVNCPQPASKANLYVTKDIVALRNRQCLGGQTCDTILKLNLRADNEAVDVTGLQFVVMNRAIQSVDRLDLYTNTGTTPFASATLGGCGTAPVVGGVTFCATMLNRQLVISAGAITKVLVKPVLKNDTNGALSGEMLQLVLSGQAVSNNVTGEGAVHARSAVSGNFLIANNGNTTADGEIFIGVSSPSPANQDIVGNKNVTVLSKIVSIANANPDPDGSMIPTGAAGIGQFRVTAAAHSNSKNGLNKVLLSGALFSVRAMNVSIDASSFRLYNKANVAISQSCAPMSLSGSPMFGVATDSFLVACTQLALSPMNIAIDQGTNQTFVLQMNVMNPKLLLTKPSTLQVSLESFNDINQTVFGVAGSHFQWIDRDSAPLGIDTTTSSSLLWVEYPDTVVTSTSYQS